MSQGLLAGIQERLLLAAFVALPACSVGEVLDESRGASCPVGETIQNRQCVPVCIISGDVFFTGEINPLNSCQVCEPSVHRRGWSDLCLRAEMYASLPVAVHMGIDGELAGGEQSRHRITQVWHSRNNPKWRGALDFGGNGAEPGALVRFSAHVVDDVTPRYHPGRAFEVEVYALVRRRGTSHLYFDPEGGRYSHTEESYLLDVFYTNPISREPVKVARLLYEHLDASGSLRLDEQGDARGRGRRVENGEQLGVLAYVTGSRYTSDGWRFTSGTHLHLEVITAGWTSWDRRIHRRRGYEGRFRQWFRSPRDLALHPDYEHRFPQGDDTAYRWWEPAFYFNDYHLHDDTRYDADRSAHGC